MVETEQQYWTLQEGTHELLQTHRPEHTINRPNICHIKSH